MSNHVRPKLPGARVFFTMVLADRGSDLLVRVVGRLREAVREVRVERPFRIDAWVILPDHMHAVWTLPEGDADFSTRWAAIKARFTRSVRDFGRWWGETHPTFHLYNLQKRQR
jgi:putative transposase